MRRLILRGLLRRLRDAGNTVVVVEHDPAVMVAADRAVIGLDAPDGSNGVAVDLVFAFDGVEGGAIFVEQRAAGGGRAEGCRSGSQVLDLDTRPGGGGFPARDGVG